MLGDIDGAVGRDEHVGAGCNLSCIFRNTINEYVYMYTCQCESKIQLTFGCVCVADLDTDSFSGAC